MGKEKKDRVSKSGDKKSKTASSSKKKDGDRKKSVPEDNTRKYGCLSNDSIAEIAESNGITNLTEEAVSSLAEDTSYRLRQVIYNCSKYTKHVKRKNLTSEDVSHVLKMSDCPTLYGYNKLQPNNLDFDYNEGTNVFVTKDKSIDLASFVLTETSIQTKPKVFVKGAWLMPDDSSVKVENKIKLEEHKNLPGQSSDKSSSSGSSKNLKHKLFNHVVNSYGGQYKSTVANIESQQRKSENTKLQHEQYHV